MNRLILTSILASIAAMPALAQETRQAAITGRGGSPKCTIEVEVDEVADVEIRGTEARLHTLRGAPATWRRFECNQPMPLNPANFRFRGIDGRGRQTLIGDARGGAIIVRIEDPRSGREGYTFDLEWGGEMGPMPIAPGPISNPQPFPGRDRDHDRRFERDDAVHECGEAAEAELRSKGYSEIHVQNAGMDNEQERGDWVYGDLNARRGPQVEQFKFACPVDWQNHRIGSVNVRYANDGFWGKDARHNAGYTKEQAMRACSDAVRERLRRDNYQDVRIEHADVEDRPGGDDDWVIGSLSARRGGFADRFQFSCSVDFDEGRVRSINVDRRWDRDRDRH